MVEERKALYMGTESRHWWPAPWEGYNSVDWDERLKILGNEDGSGYLTSVHVLQRDGINGIEDRVRMVTNILAKGSLNSRAS